MAIAKSGRDDPKLEAEFAKLERLLESLGERLERRADNIDLAFAALRDREWHQRLFRELGNDFEMLGLPISIGRGIKEEESDWLQGLVNWRGKLDQWLIIAEYYAPGMTEGVLKVHKHLFDMEWPFDEKPLTANQAYRYKELSIWWGMADAGKSRLDKCLEQAIFMSLSKKGRLDSPPGMDK